MWASELNLSLQPEQTPRLLALWERPQFVWTISGDNSAIEQFLKTLASWTETKRLGFLKTAKAEQRLHPSLQLNREDRDLASLLNDKKNGWTDQADQPILIHWS